MRNFNQKSDDFDRSFRFVWTFFKIVIPVVFALAIAQFIATAYAAIKYGPRIIDAGASYLERH